MASRILIADDNAAVRTALRELLKNEGWETVAAANGQEAIARAREIKPQLVILDLAMPFMDGLSAAREITKLLPDVPIIMHTLYSSPQVEIEGRKVGVRRMVAKSESGDLLSAVREVLPMEAPIPSPSVSDPIATNVANNAVTTDIKSAAPVANPATESNPTDPAVKPPGGSGGASS